MPITRYLITAANSYLGQHFAQHFSRCTENKIFTTSRSDNAFPSKATNQQHLGGIDLIKSEDLIRLADAISSWADGPFNIINCVGFFPGYKPIDETSVDEARKVFESNLLALYATAHALIPIMRIKGGGHFVAFSSHAVTESYPLMAAFTAAKTAVDSLIQSIANEYSKDRIVANALAIATVDTPRERHLRPRANYSDWLSVEQVIRCLEELVQQPFDVMNGNTIHLFNYSDTFFHESYYDRLGLDRGNNARSSDDRPEK